MHACISRFFTFSILLISSLSIKNSWPLSLPELNYKEYGLALEAIFDMGVRLQLLLDTSTKENFIVSPLSAASVIGQLMLGAEGEFKNRLYELLSITDEESNEPEKNKARGYGKFHSQMSKLLDVLKQRTGEENYTLCVNDALFYNDFLTLKDHFKNNLYQIYETDVRALDFSQDNASSIINDWISLNTHGLITSLIRPPLSPYTTAIFLNSIYFRAEWETKFSNELNTISPFHIDKDTKVDTVYMQEEILEIPYAQVKDYRLICLPYSKKKFGMYILFPNKDNEFKYDIKQFCQSIDLKDLGRTLLNLKTRDVLVKIPKLSLSNRFSILEPLRKYAAAQKVHETSSPKHKHFLETIKNEVNIARNSRPSPQTDIYLSGATEDAPLKVSDIIQQTIFSIHEDGTEAVSVTYSFVDRMGGAKSFVLNRPFAFFIRHEESSATIFWGTISNPLSS